MKIISVISFLALATAPSAAKTFTFDDASCSKDAELSSVMINGGNSFALGEDVTVKGILSLPEDFDTEATVTLEGCIKLFFFPFIPMCEELSTGSACDMLIAVDGQDCGTAGSYGFSVSQATPAVNVNVLMAVDLRAKIKHVTNCVFDLDASSSSTAMILGMSIVSTALLVSGFVFSKKRRNIATQGDEKATPFIEMSNV